MAVPMQQGQYSFVLCKIVFDCLMIGVYKRIGENMGLLPDTNKNCGLRMRRECWERFHRQRVQRKALVINPGMHYGTCVAHVPWYMSGSLSRGVGENVPGIPDAYATLIFLRIWQEAHWRKHDLNWTLSIIVVIIHACGRCALFVATVHNHCPFHQNVHIYIIKILWITIW